MLRNVFDQIASYYDASMRCQAMSAEVCVSDVGFSSVVARVLRETDV